MSPFCRQVQRQILDTAMAPFYQRVHVQSSPIGKATSVVHIVHTVSLTLLFASYPTHCKDKMRE